MSDEDDPVPQFNQNVLPAGLAALLAGLEGGEHGLNAVRGAFNRTQEGYPQILEEEGTPLRDLAQFTRQEVDDLTNFAASKGVTGKIVAGGEGPAGAAFYERGILEKLLDRLSPGSKPSLGERVGLRSTSMPVAMHELGHASPILGSAKLRDVWQGMGNALAGDIQGGALRTLLIGNALAPKEDGGVRGFAQEHAPALIAATYTPQLLEEARATANALRGAVQYGPGIAAVARELLPAFGTYAAAAAIPAGATLLAQKIVQALRGRGEEKSAAPMPGKEVQSPGILRASADAAWHTGLSAPKPKTTKPNTNPEGRAKETVKAKPPSKTAYFSDTIKSLYNPQRGYRGAKPQV